MIDGFQNAMYQLIETRLEEIINSEEYVLFFEAIYNDLEEKLSSITEPLDEETKNEMMEDIKSNLFDQFFNQSKFTYKAAFSDSFTFLINNVLLPRNK
ncbi:hypothetical protein [Virgibacillus oceani]|uniref:Uncharacterized protein n=1 Tax=Virgibacillus oceani TaxID=1479511 RepID=A0A917LWE5_9BACI|nr:hypothetical protein [Virgibacillus oceani]GGG61234.1 hypothetical protein GCM10011398_00650 [Virgibacillus oceani]